MITIKEKENIRKYGKEIECINGIRFYEGYSGHSRCYGVQQLSTGYCAVFNHRKKILDTLMDMVRNGVNICRGNNGNMIIFQGSKKIVPLAMFLYSTYNCLDDYGAGISNNLRHYARNGKYIENCKEDNLYIGGVSVYYDEKKSRVVAVSNTQDFIDEFEPLPILLDIMNSKKFVLQWGIGERLRCRAKGEVFFPADLAYLAYYDGGLSLDNYIEKIRELKRYKENNGLSEEHLDGDFHNHLKYNIALVPASANSKKNDKISTVKEPYFFTVVYDKPMNSGISNGGIFKILTGVFDDDLMMNVNGRFVTDNFENVAEMLDIFIKEFPERVNGKEAKAENKRLIFDRGFAEQLAKEPKEKFTCLDSLGKSR